MKNITSVETNKSDCDVILDRFENTIVSLDNCVESIFDDKKTKMNVLGNLFQFSSSLTKLTFGALGCAVKNTPKAVVAISVAKREIVDELEKEWSEHQKQQQIDALDEKIKQLKVKH